MIKKIMKCLLACAICLSMIPASDIQAKEDYRTWAQSDSRWGSIKLGSSSKTMSKVGCLVTAMTKTIVQASFKDSESFNPGTFVKWLNKNGGFSGANFDWSKAEKYIPEFDNCGRLMTKGTYSSSKNNDKLIKWIKQGYHLLLNVDNGGHWIAVDEKKTLETGTVYIMDSLKSKANADVKLTSRYSTFNQVHAYKGGSLLDEEPEISNVKYLLDKTGVTVSAKVVDDFGIKKVTIDTWTSHNDKDDLKQDVLEVKNNNISYRVLRSDHHLELGEYQSTITVEDTKGNKTIHTIKYNVEDIKEVKRLYGDDRYQTSYKAADELKVKLGVSKFDTFIVASGEKFADALAGSYLSSKINAPIIMTNANDYMMKDTLNYIKNNLKSEGTVYILGGTSAIPSSFESQLTDFQIKRLAGDTRYTTNLEILKEAGITNDEILVCTGNTFADSLSASATGLPILLVNQTLSDEQKEYLSSFSQHSMTIIGGENAISKELEEELKAYGDVNRIAGNTRYDTSIQVANHYFNKPTHAVMAYAQNFPDGLSGGPLAYILKSPLILTDNDQYNQCSDYIDTNNVLNGYVLGGSTLIKDDTVKQIFDLSSHDIFK